MQSVELYDTTLRDGAQTWGITFSLDDKIRIARKLDELGIHYIEGGYPGSNPKDRRFFEVAREMPFKKSKLVAFGSTCKPNIGPEKDIQVKTLVESGTDVVNIVGKSWDLHARGDSLRLAREESGNDPRYHRIPQKPVLHRHVRR